MTEFTGSCAKSYPPMVAALAQKLSGPRLPEKFAHKALGLAACDRWRKLEKRLFPRSARTFVRRPTSTHRGSGAMVRAALPMASRRPRRCAPGRRPGTSPRRKRSAEGIASLRQCSVRGITSIWPAEKTADVNWFQFQSRTNACVDVAHSRG